MAQSQLRLNLDVEGKQMVDFEIADTPGLGSTITIHVGESSIHVIPLTAIASWGELLGITDPGDILDAILHVAKHGEPDPDPETGENAWTPAYEALQAREQKRAKEWFTATTDGTATDPRSPKLRAAFAASPLESLVEAGRNETRTRLGLPPLDQVQTRTVHARTSDDDLWGELKNELRTRHIAIERAKEEFLNELRPPLPEEAH